jgi:Replication-relaxation
MASTDRSRPLRIGPAGRAALQLLATCPRMPTDVVRVLLGQRHAACVAQLLARLRRAGLAEYRTARLGPLLGSRPIRLWALSAAGYAVLATRGVMPTVDHRRQLPYGEPDRAPGIARRTHLPTLIAAYQLLADVARGLERPVRLGAWEQPWSRTYQSDDGGPRRHVRLPAAAVLRDDEAPARRTHRLLLIPDVGTAALASYRAALRGLIELRRAADVDDDDEPLLIVGVATPSRSFGARQQAWRSLLNHVARRAGARPLRARVVVCDTVPASDQDRGGQSVSQVDEVFGLVARHPLLTRQQLATLLGTSATRIGRLVALLVEAGWLRPVRLEELPRCRMDEHTREQVRRLGLIQLTPAGRREAARRLLVSDGGARQRHGILQGDDATGRFVRHLHHTLGANGVFVAFAAAARRVTRTGARDALAEWRSAAACARGRFRPDGYGCYRRGPWRFGFFLEYDRGTERPSDYAAKLAAYYRYRDTRAFTRDYDGFPALLVVTTAEEAEARFAYQAYLAQRQRGSVPLSVLFTTTRRIDHDADGIVGPIWRAPGSDAWADGAARMHWLPGMPRAPTRPAIRYGGRFIELQW